MPATSAMLTYGTRWRHINSATDRDQPALLAVRGARTPRQSPGPARILMPSRRTGVMRAHAAPGAPQSASRRSGAAAVSGHDEPHRPGLRALPSSGAVHRPAAAGSSRLPGPLHGHLAQP